MSWLTLLLLSNFFSFKVRVCWVPTSLPPSCGCLHYCVPPSLGNAVPDKRMPSERRIKVKDLEVFILEALPTNPLGSGNPQLVILLHGFPELAYSWRKVIQPLADHGYHVVCPDQRGYGKTTQSRVTYDDELAPYRMLNLASDIVSLVHALGYSSAAGIVGHDFGSTVAAHCALARPDIFKSLVMMSAPFTGIDSLADPPAIQILNKALSTLNPPKKHYTIYFSTPDANKDMTSTPSLREFLRAYYHTKSADWKGNDACEALPTFPPSPKEMADHIPGYYIMPLELSMPQTLLALLPDSYPPPPSTWLTDAELEVYATEFGHTGFQGGLNWYRCKTQPHLYSDDLQIFQGKSMEVPTMFIGGCKDWGINQIPGALERMKSICRIEDQHFVLVEGAGHWVQQEKADVVVDHLVKFLHMLG